MPWSLFPTKRPTISKTTLDLLVLFGIVLAFYFDPFLNFSKVSYGGDALGLFVPSFEHYRQTMYQGIVPLWNSHTWMGAPFLASFQSAVLYPPNLLSLFFDDSASAMNFSIFLSIMWLAFGSYIFGVRALKLERFPSILMGVAMSCSAFVGAHADHVNQLAAISWIPWILSESLLLLLKPKLKHVALLSVCIGFQILAGHPQYVVYTLSYLMALVACYIVYLYHRRKFDSPPAWMGTVLVGASILIGLGLGAAQLLPSAELAAVSVRQTDGPERMFTNSFPPSHLLTLVYPHAFGDPITGQHNLMGVPLIEDEAYNFNELACYVGVVTMALAALAVATMFKEFVVRCFLLLGLFVLLVAFGEFVPEGVAYRVAHFWAPGIEHMRVPARIMIFFDLSMVVLAAMGFNQVVYYLKERQRVRVSTLAPLRVLILVIVVTDLYLFSSSQIFRYNEGVEVLEGKGPVREHLEKNPGEYRVFRQMREVFYFPDQESLVKSRERRRVVANLQNLRLQPNMNIFGRHQTTEGYEEGLLPTMSMLNFLWLHRRNLRTATPDTLLMGLMNVRYVLTDKPQKSDRLRHVLKHRIIHETDGDFGFYALGEDHWSGGEDMRYALYENLDYVPRFVWAEPLRRALDLKALDFDTRRPDRRLARVDRSRPYMAYRKEGADLEALRESLENTALDLHRPGGSSNAYVLSKPEEQAGELLMLEAAYPGWVCEVNGEKKPLRRVNTIMMGCDVPAGATTLEFRFEPFSFRLGLFVSCLFVMLLTCGAFFWRLPVRAFFWREE